MNTVVPTKCRVLYKAFASMQAQGTLKSLADAEAVLKNFGAKVDEKNTIEMDVLIFGKEYQERLFEYNIPLTGDRFATFYVDKNLGFGHGHDLPENCLQAIKTLHLKQSNQQTSKLH